MVSYDRFLCPHDIRIIIIVLLVPAYPMSRLSPSAAGLTRVSRSLQQHTRSFFFPKNPCYIIPGCRGLHQPAHAKGPQFLIILCDNPGDASTRLFSFYTAGTGQTNKQLTPVSTSFCVTLAGASIVPERNVEVASRVRWDDDTHTHTPLPVFISRKK